MAKKETHLQSKSPSTKKPEKTHDSKKKKNPQPSNVPVIATPEDETSSEDNSGSEDDSETDSETSKETSKKRGNEGNTSTAEDEVKRAKTDIGTSSTKMFQRIWSEDDEILLLEGMIIYETDKGKNASKNVNEFCDFVKDSLSIKNVGQINTKLRNMKKKFLAKMAKGCDESSFAKSHDRKCWILSKKIWGNDHSVVKSSKRKTQVEESVDEWFQRSYLVSGLGTVGLLSENAVKEKWKKVPLKTKKIIQERGRLVEVKEIECTNDKTGLLHDVSSIFTQIN